MLEVFLILLLFVASSLWVNLFKIGTATRDSMANAFDDACNAGTPPARIEHRVGAQPTNVGDASSGSLLGTNIASNPMFGASSTGVITAGSIANDSSADNSGTAGYFRIYTGAGGDTAALAQGNTGNVSGTFDMEFDNEVIVAGGVIAISAMTVTVPIS